MVTTIEFSTTSAPLELSRHAGNLNVSVDRFIILVDVSPIRTNFIFHQQKFDDEIDDSMAPLHE